MAVMGKGEDRGWGWRPLRGVSCNGDLVGECVGNANSYIHREGAGSGEKRGRIYHIKVGNGSQTRRRSLIGAFPDGNSSVVAMAETEATVVRTAAPLDGLRAGGRGQAETFPAREVDECCVLRTDAHNLQIVSLAGRTWSALYKL